MKAKLTFILLCLCVLRLYGGPTYPIWWIEWDVASSQPPAALGESGYDPDAWASWEQSNYAIANLGQLKWLTAKAYSELAMKLAHLDGNIDTSDPETLEDKFTELNNLVTSFGDNQVVNNYSVANQGQLKHVVSKVYDVLHEAGFNQWPAGMVIDTTTGYPWTSATTDDSHQAPANLGQLKWLFSWDVYDWASTADADGDNIPDWWEAHYFSDVTGFIDYFRDSDGDGVSDYAEFMSGTDPDTPDFTTADQGPGQGVLIVLLGEGVYTALEEDDATSHKTTLTAEGGAR